MGPITPPHAVRADIRCQSEKIKTELYDVIQRVRQEHNMVVQIHEYKSGLPTCMVDCADIHVLTDLVSLNRWAVKQGHRDIFEIWPHERILAAAGAAPEPVPV